MSQTIAILEFAMGVSDQQNLDGTTHYYNTSFEAGGYPNDGDEDTEDNQTRRHYDHVWVNGFGGGGSEDNHWQNDSWDWAGNHSGNLGGLNGSLTWDGLGDGWESGTTTADTNTTSFNYFSTVWGYLGNEHCNVTDPVNQRWNYDDEDESHGSQHDTYTRQADTVWHVQTGGRAIPGRQSLWQFSGWAAEILNKRAVPAWSRYVPMREITNKTQIVLQDLGALKADGTLWLTLPDDVDKDVTPTVAGKDFYTFGVSGVKYKLTIAARGNGNNYDDLSLVTPEFCVGQSLTFSANWSPTTPNFLSNDIRWHLPDKFVNQATNYSPTCTTYVKDENLLTNAVTQCWYVRDPGGACSVREILQFAYGQYINIAAAGSFTIYRPIASQPDASGPFHASIEGSISPTLQLAKNAMNFTETINSKYPGSFGLTQLVKMYSETILIPPDLLQGATTWGNFNLDVSPDGSTGEYYDGPKKSSATCQINDAPGQPLFFVEGDYTGFWKDYVRFTPNGDGSIPITLSRIDWNWAATSFDDQVSWWTITSDGVDGPTLYGDDNFPLWKSQGISSF